MEGKQSDTFKHTFFVGPSTTPEKSDSSTLECIGVSNFAADWSSDCFMSGVISAENENIELTLKVITKV